mmetsp:Transcript_25635/g.52159  ORF Transcript_25635/g.52159 Transcript_25635/m.52159 type:complete len:175 (+) Transcript_25635:1101-1625(+)
MGPLHEASVKAYSSYIRSYPAKEKAVRHIFSPRALHLGHIARSFALKEQPKALAGKRRGADGPGDKDEDVLKSTGRKRNQRLAFGVRTSATSSGKRGGDDDNDADGSERGPKKKARKGNRKSFADPALGKKSKKKSKMEGAGFDGGEKRSVGDNKKRMVAMAVKLQGSGISEFF